jgi:hypothetical protein
MLSSHINPYFFFTFFWKFIKTWVKNWVATLTIPKFTSTRQTFQSPESPKHPFAYSKGSLQPDDLPRHIWKVLLLVSETHNIPLRAYQPYSIRNDLSNLTIRLTTPPQTDIPKCDNHWVFQCNHELITLPRVYSSRSCVYPLFHSRNHVLLLRESPALNPKSPGSFPPLTMGATH